MHQSSLQNFKAFIDCYLSDNSNNDQDIKIIEIGSFDENGNIKKLLKNLKFEYIGIDFVDGNNVDLKISDPYNFPLENATCDLVLCSSVFEHSEFFWILFLECLRILKPTGLLYIQTPSNGIVHRYPIDAWRFYPDSGKALEGWAERNLIKCSLLESYISPQGPKTSFENQWNDQINIFIKDKSYTNIYKKRISDNNKSLSVSYSLDRKIDKPQTEINEDQFLHLSTIYPEEVVINPFIKDICKKEKYEKLIEIFENKKKLHELTLKLNHYQNTRDKAIKDEFPLLEEIIENQNDEDLKLAYKNILKGIYLFDTKDHQFSNLLEQVKNKDNLILNLNSEILNLNSEISNLNSEILNLNSEVFNFNKKITNSSNQVKLLLEENKKLINHVKNIESSKLWKLNRFLKKIKKFIIFFKN